MSITVELSSEEIAQMTRLTNQQDGALAVAHAAREYLRIRRLRELSAMSGQVDYDDNWEHMETLELAEVDFPR
jgi:hypothetical protein